jgi:hypothetical protein
MLVLLDRERGEFRVRTLYLLASKMSASEPAVQWTAPGLR